MSRPPSIRPVFLAVLLVLTGLVRPAAGFTVAQAKATATVTLVRSDGADCGVGCGEWIALAGRIDAGTPALLGAVLARLGRRNVPLLVDSPGGSVLAAMEIGRAVRARKMAVAVASTSLTDCAASDDACAARRRFGERSGFVGGSTAACASACVLVLAAGVERSVAPFTPLGVHQMTARKTITRVMNHFRVLSRMVNGRRVEVSRTLIGTEPISSRTVVVAAPETTYSEVDRYLLGLGIAESIMPLMRSAPPSGIHWMTPAEIVATRIATDSLDARTLVARAAAAEPPAAPKPRVAQAPPGPAAQGNPAAQGDPAAQGTMALATATLGDGRRDAGIVDWRVTGTPTQPALTGTVDVPGLGLHGTLAIRPDTAPGASGGFLAGVDLGRPAAIEPGRTWTTDAPRLCDAATCNLPFTPVAETDDGQGRREFRVRAVWGDGFLSNLRDRDRIAVPLSAEDGKKGWLSLSIDRDAREAVALWERRCCGLASSPSVVSGTSRATLATAASPGSGPLPDDGTVRWRFDAGAPADRPASLQGTIEIPRLAASISLTADAGSLVVALRATRGAAGSAVTLTAGPPGFRDRRDGPDEALGASPSGDGATAILTVPAADRAAAVEGFRHRNWFALPIRIAGRDGTVLLLNLNGAGRPAIDAWLAHGPTMRAPAPPASAAAAPEAASPPASASWTLIHEGALPPRPGAVSLLGSIEVPSVGLRLSLAGGLAAPGGIALTVQAVPDVARFGPVADLAVRPVAAADGRVALTGAAYRRAGGYDVTLAPAAPLPPGAKLAFALTDALGRRLDVAVPLPNALGDLLAAAARSSS